MSGGLLAAFCALLGALSCASLFAARALVVAGWKPRWRAPTRLALWAAGASALGALLWLAPGSGWRFAIAYWVLLCWLNVAAAVEVRAGTGGQRFAFHLLYVGLVGGIWAYARFRGMLDGVRASERYALAFQQFCAELLTPLLRALGLSVAEIHQLVSWVVMRALGQLGLALSVACFGYAAFSYAYLADRDVPVLKPGVAAFRFPFAATAGYAGLGLVVGFGAIEGALADALAPIVVAWTPYFVLEGVGVLLRWGHGLRRKATLAWWLVLWGCADPWVAVALAALGATSRLLLFRDPRPTLGPKARPRLGRAWATSVALGAGLWVCTVLASERIAGLSPFLERTPAECAQRGCETLDVLRSLGPVGPHAVRESVSSHPEPREAMPAPSADARSDVLSVALIGELDMSGSVRASVMAESGYNPLAAARAVLGAPHLVYGALDSPLTDRAPTVRSVRPQQLTTGPPAAAAALALGGVDALAVASGTLLQLGPPGLADTLAVLEAAEIHSVGAVAEGMGHPGPLSVEVEGWRIALFAWDVGQRAGDGASRPKAQVRRADRLQSVRQARAAHDAVIVYDRGHEALVSHPDVAHRKRFAELVAAGADVVVGGGAHVPLGVEWFDKGIGLYSLGRFVAPELPNQPWANKGYVARLAFARGGPLEVELCPYYLAAGEPRPLVGRSGVAQEGIFFRKLTRLTARVGDAVVREPTAQSCMRVERAASSAPASSDAAAPPP